MKTFTARGANRYLNCEILGDVLPVGLMTQRIEVEDGTPGVIAAIYDPNTGNCPDPSKVTITVTGPDGTVYNQPTNTGTVFVSTAGGSAYVICVLNPLSGLWTLTCRCTADASYRANIFTIPSGNPFDSARFALAPYYPNTRNVPADQFNYRLYRWGFLSVAALVSSIVGTTSPAMDPAQLLCRIFGISATLAQQIVALARGQTVDGTGITVGQQIGAIVGDVKRNALINGDGSQGLAGWNVIASGGAGWSVQNGYATSIGYNTNFAASNGWCKKSKTIDLLQGAGLTAQYLDQVPPITVSDWIAANYPAGTTPQSQYYLLVELRDANQNALKRFQTGTLSIPATLRGGNLRWQRIDCNFTNYGQGVRYIYFEHGGLDPQAFTADYGIKMTGAKADVALAIPSNLREVLQNGSAQNGLNNWTASAGTWTVETGPALSCPGSPGTKDFAVATGTGTKSQLIDLVAAGYAASFLDTSPVVQFSDWMCAEANCTCSYRWRLELRRGDQSVIQSYDSGAVAVTAAFAGFSPFVRYVQSLSEYGAGLRYIYFEHSATPGMAGVTAKLTGGSVLLPAPPPQARNRKRATAAKASATVPTPINNTTVVPYRWVCQLEMDFADNTAALCTGWLVPSPRPGVFQVVTAGHCIKDRSKGWPTRIRVQPAAGNQGGSPYQRIDVPRGRMQVPIEWLLNNQTAATWGELHDYGSLYVPGPANWDAGGFNPTVEDDGTLRNQAGTITGFPAASPYSSPGMYTQDITLGAWNDTQVSASTDFTGGSSGGPIYVRGTQNAVSIESYGDYLNLLSQGTTRINQKVAQAVTRWATPLQATDRITKLQMVVRTGTDWGAGTDDDIVCTIDNNRYDLEGLWFKGASGLSSRNEAGAYDGYDLTSRLNEIYPAGINIQYLLGKTYSIKRDPSVFMYHSIVNGDWQVESVAIFVNDQLLCAKNFFQWVYYRIDYVGSVTGTFTLG